MSSRDYIDLAADFKRLRAGFTGEQIFAVDQTILTVCDALKRDNPRFDRDRFLTACGR